MTEENQAYTVNTDGSISIKEDGKSIKYVKESDMGAVKAQLKDKEGEVTKLTSSLADSVTKYDTSHQDVLKERAAREQFEKDAGESTTLKEKVTELETKMADLTKVGGERDTSLTERIRKSLTDGYKVDADKIKDMSLVDLEKTEATLVLTGVQAAPANYDGKGNGGTNTAEDLKGKSPLALAAMGYETSNKK